MTQARSALRCLSLAAMMQLSCARAGVWGIDPLIGVVSDYSTNAQLLDAPHTALTDGALLLNGPTTYNGNGVELYVTPSFRFSNSTGYSAVTSNYERLNIKGEFDTDLDVLSAAAGISQDSSLYYDYLTDGGVGVRRDSWTADVNWDRRLTERMEIDTDAATTQVRYGHASGVFTLTDYKYTSISPTFAWNSSERGKLTIDASVGRYNSLDGATSSGNANLQVGFVRQLSEIWTLTSLAGYSRANNRFSGDEEVLEFTQHGPVIVLIPFTVKSSQNGTVYSLNLNRQGERLSLTASASRELLPIGFEYLALQNTFELTAGYVYSERLSFNAAARYMRTQTPQEQGPSQQVTPKFASISASWRWTEHWTASVAASYVTETYTPPTPSVHVSSSELSITLSRQFDHIKFQ
jgi:hypothetical protein